MSEACGCACKAVDAYDCFARRYNIRSFEYWDDAMPDEPTLRELVDCSGGPCECVCHYDEDPDEPWDDRP